MTTNREMQRFLGGIEQGYKAITHATGAYTIKIYDAVVNVDTSTGTIANLTLPNTVPVGTVREHTVYDKGGAANTNPITVLAPGGGTINGGASLVISEPFGGVTFVTDDGLNYTAATAVSGIVGPSDAVYVDPAGDDATGARGNAAFPFLTVEAGLAATQDGDELLIAPGTFSPLVPLTPPVGVHNLIVRGSGNGETGAGGGTVIDDTNIGGANVWDFINLMNNLLMENMTLDGANGIINLDGSTSGGNFGIGGIQIRNVSAGGGLAALDVNFLTWVGGIIEGSCTVTTCSHVVFSGLDGSAVGATITWDSADANKPATARDAVYYSATLVGGITIVGQGAVEIGKGSSCLNITGSSPSAAGGLAPVVRCYGIVRDLIDFDTATKQLPDSAIACTMNFDGALIQGATIKFSVAGAPPTHAQSVTMRNATVTAAVITAGSDILFDADGLQLGLTASFVSSGTPVGVITAGYTISPAQIVATTNDYTPTNISAARVVRINSDATRLVTGLAAGVQGEIKTIINVGSFPIVLQNQNTGSVAGNRFLGEADCILIPDRAISIEYDLTTARWRFVDLVPFAPNVSFGPSVHEWIQPSGLRSALGLATLWTDDSGAGQTMATAIAAPTVGVLTNGLTGLITNGTTQSFGGGSSPTIFQDAYQFHAFIVVKPTAAGSAAAGVYYQENGIIMDTLVRWGFAYQRVAGHDYFLVGVFVAGSGLSYQTTAAGAAQGDFGSPYIVEAWLDPTDQFLRLRVNNGATVVSAAPVVGSFASGLTALVIGNSPGLGTFQAQNFGEAHLSSRMLSVAERNYMRGYLTAKWNIVT